MFYYYQKYKSNSNLFSFIPLTYHIKYYNDKQWIKFWQQNYHSPNKIWIIKPGQNTNRGTGIHLSTTLKVSQLIQERKKHTNGQKYTYIIQSYIEKPFLYYGRKFDIRHFLLLNSVNGYIKAYWYKQGYIRTSSEIYDITDIKNEYIHLTNDAIQQHSEQYSKYEQNNKLSYSQLQRYLDYIYPNKNYNFEKDILKKMKQLILDVLNANYLNIDPDRKLCNFQIFGFDFIIDHNFQPYLIQINANPCLQIRCPLMNRIIPAMIQNSLRIGLDPLLPPRYHFPYHKRFDLSDNYLKNLRYEMIFDESQHKHEIIQNILNFEESDDDQQQQYADQGKQINQLQI